METLSNGIYQVHRYNWSKDVDEVIGQFAIVKGCVVFWSTADRLNCNLIPEGPINGYTALRIENMLRSAIGTARMHLQRISNLPSS